MPQSAARAPPGQLAFGPMPRGDSCGRLEFEAEVDAVLVGPGRAYRAAGLQPLPVHYGAQEDAAVELPAQPGAGHVAHVVGGPRRVVGAAVVAPPRVPPALVDR